MWKRMEQFSTYLLPMRLCVTNQSATGYNNNYDISLFNDIK
jgi:hypothetical protein